MRTIARLALTAALVALPACSTEPRTAEKRERLSTGASAALDRFTSKDPTLQAQLDRAAGYAIFPEIGKVGVGVGGAYGKGEVWENGRRTGYCDVSAGTVGLQLGAETFSELIVFQTGDALNRFKSNQFAFTAAVSAVAITSGAAAQADYHDGVAVFIDARGGLMAEASVGGQKFTFSPTSEFAGSFDDRR
jgi:lipid-binding SYLF domain-containing protein